MDTNPYQSPGASDRADVVTGALPSPSRADLPLGACCLFIAFWIAAIAVSQRFEFEGAAPAEVGAAIASVASFVLAFTLMGLGLLRHSNRVVWAGFALLMLPPLAIVAYSLTQ